MATKLVNLKMTPSEQKKQSEPSAIATESRYPYGLTIGLDTDTLDKLQLDELPTAGDTMLLIAKATVRSVSTSEGEGGPSRSVSLQITDLCLEAGGADDDEDDAEAVAAKLYDRKAD